MAILPTKFLKIAQSTVDVEATWDTAENGDLYTGFPYKWKISLAVTPQIHASPSSPTPYQFDGTDIKVGDWIATGAGGLAVRIYEIVTPGPSTVVVLVEDVERFNIMNDGTFSGNGIGPDGPGYLFSLDSAGNPILGPTSPYYMDITFQDDLISRFNYRNTVSEFYQVLQVGQTFAQGDIVFLDIDGVYKPIASNAANKDNLQRIIGSVSSTGVPGPDYFTIRPRGDVLTNINPPLPTGLLPGQFAYIDPANPGKLTAVKPSLYATPIFIRLGDDTTGLFLGGGVGGASAGPLGYNVSGYTVATLAARDALDTTVINTGDTAFVANDGTGKWALYEVTAITAGTPPVLTWTKISSQTIVEFDPSTISNSKIVNDDASTFVDTKAVANSVTAGSNAKTVLQVTGSTTDATAGEKLTISHSDNQVTLSASNTAGTGDVDVRVLPQAQGHVYFGALGDGVVEAELGYTLTVKGGNSSTTAPGDTLVQGGKSTSGNFNGGNVVLTGGVGFGTGSAGTVSVTDISDTKIIEFLSSGSSSSNWVELTNGTSDPTPATNGILFAVASASSSANVDIYFGPKGTGLNRVKNYASYMSGLNTAGNNDALVTKGYVDALTGNTGGADPVGETAGVGLTDNAGTFDVNIAALTVGVDGSNNLIVKSSALANQVLISAGTLNAQATWGALNLADTNAVSGTLSAANGGTGIGTIAVGDLLVGADANTLTKISIGSVGKVLMSTGPGAAPAYSYVSQLYDTAGALALDSVAVPSAQNNLYVKNGIDGGVVEFGSEGSSTDIGILLNPKGSAIVSMKPGYTSLIAGDRETVVTKGYVDDSITGAAEPFMRKAAISSGWNSVMNIGTMGPNPAGKSVYVYRVLVNVITPLTGGGVAQAQVTSNSDIPMSFMENDILTAGAYVAETTESFSSNNTQFAIAFFTADGVTQATPTGGSIEVSVYYRIR